jgi:hypothetical protein
VAALVLLPSPSALACAVGAGGLVLWFTALRPRPPRNVLRVGADGIAIRTDMGTTFVAYARMDRVEEAPFGGILRLHDGDPFPVAVVPPALLGADRGWSSAWELAAIRRAAFLRRIREGLDGVEPIAGEERVARQGRTIEGWRSAMRDLVRADAPGYRAPILPTEQAARIVESGHAAPEARIGAALALAPSADPKLKKRLRVALEASVDDSTRRAITEALDDRLEPWRLEMLERRAGR